MSESEIARRLDITQAAVSKYISGSYSPKIKKIADFIASRKLHIGAVNAILGGSGSEKIADLIDSIASERSVIGLALKISI